MFFLGLQGSYGRGEAREESDIDLVVILDYMCMEDLETYDKAVSDLPYREKLCGFLAGREEVENWERSDLFQFYHDTVPLFGDLEKLIPPISEEDIKRAIRIGACNLYHMCGHNVVHDKQDSLLKDMYKAAAFVNRALYYDKTGQYIKKEAEFLNCLTGEELEIEIIGQQLKNSVSAEKAKFREWSALLFQWSGNLIRQYGEKETICYQELKREELNIELFRYFERNQKVTDCVRKVDGKWVIQRDPFIDQWGPEEYRFLVQCLRNTVDKGGLVLGAFREGRLKGFVSVEGEPIGKERTYMDLTSLHISEESRGKGMGKELFLRAARWAREKGAEKLYISSHSAVETQAFYKAMGCVDAVEYSQEHVKKEPYDRQLEYLL